MREPPEQESESGAPKARREAVRGKKWRRWESNPRPLSYRQSVYKLVPSSNFARTAGDGRPTAGLAILWRSHLGRSRSLGV
jgi:hypothetical protein